MNKKNKMIKYTEEDKKLFRQLCEDIDSGKIVFNESTETYQEKIDKISTEELIQELIRPIDGVSEEVNLDDVPEFDRAATPEEIA